MTILQSSHLISKKHNKLHTLKPIFQIINLNNIIEILNNESILQALLQSSQINNDKNIQKIRHILQSKGVIV